MCDYMEENQDQIKFKISPKFNFFYEMGMPTGRKIRSSLSKYDFNHFLAGLLLDILALPLL